MVFPKKTILVSVVLVVFSILYYTPEVGRVERVLSSCYHYQLSKLINEFYIENNGHYPDGKDFFALMKKNAITERHFCTNVAIKILDDGLELDGNLIVYEFDSAVNQGAITLFYNDHNIEIIKLIDGESTLRYYEYETDEWSP